jgi:hypothetical protein
MAEKFNVPLRDRRGESEIANASQKRWFRENCLDNVMNEVFHENSVIWKRASAWDAFGFFGGGGSGRTTLSFDFALRLLRDQTLDLGIFDDRFILDSNTIQRDGDNTWGREDGLGKRREFEEEANSQNKQLNDFLPAKGDQYLLGHVTIWFLDHRDGLEYYRESLGFKVSRTVDKKRPISRLEESNSKRSYALL